jgi:hypothetical protein
MCANGKRVKKVSTPPMLMRMRVSFWKAQSVPFAFVLIRY